ncbi:translation initiation factor IF-2-like [Lutra lutra]|uniref:translation initiation factor IF-2-like n=1 Tax=Lutra lutra TaxID=9657 RepID=UPI001FD4969F|nr:translation initiation factor IF-2-like [Lutra lutra]
MPVRHDCPPPPRPTPLWSLGLRVVCIRPLPAGGSGWWLCPASLSRQGGDAAGSRRTKAPSKQLPLLPQRPPRGWRGAWNCALWSRPPRGGAGTGRGGLGPANPRSERPGAGLPLPAGAGPPARCSERSRERESERARAAARPGTLACGAWSPRPTVLGVGGARDGGLHGSSPRGSWQRPVVPLVRAGGAGVPGAAAPRWFPGGMDGRSWRAAMREEPRTRPRAPSAPPDGDSSVRLAAPAARGEQPCRSPRVAWLALARTREAAAHAAARWARAGSRCPRSRRDPLVFAGVQVPSNAGRVGEVRRGALRTHRRTFSRSRLSDEDVRT